MYIFNVCLWGRGWLPEFFALDKHATKIGVSCGQYLLCNLCRYGLLRTAAHVRWSVGQGGLTDPPGLTHCHL